MFQLKFAIITPALITGSFAERVRFSSYLLFMVLFSLLIYCPLAHWTWHPDGFLRKWGVLDFAGGTVVHMSAGFAALAGAMVLGRRKSHLAKEAHAPANIPFVLLGTGMLWFGWFGFNAGSAPGRQRHGGHGVRDHQHGVGRGDAGLDVLRLDAWARSRRPSGPASARSSAWWPSPPRPASSRSARASSSAWSRASSATSPCTCRTKSTLDDTLDVFPCHGVGGMVGMIATGIFAKDVGLTSGETTTFIYHCIALVIVAAFSFVGSLILYKVTDLIIPLRVTDEQEDDGPRPQPARRDGPRRRPPRRCPCQREAEGPKTLVASGV